MVNIYTKYYANKRFCCNDAHCQLWGPVQSLLLEDWANQIKLTPGEKNLSSSPRLNPLWEIQRAVSWVVSMSNGPTDLCKWGQLRIVWNHSSNDAESQLRRSEASATPANYKWDRTYDPKFTNLHGITFQNTLIFFNIAIKTTNHAILQNNCCGLSFSPLASQCIYLTFKYISSGR
jgi:hypothetical protein